MRDRVCACLAALVILAAAACQADRAPGTLPWSAVALPDGSDPRALAVLGTAVVIAGQQREPATAPQLLRVSPGEKAAAMALQPRSPYAKVAELRAVATQGGRVVALGGRSGGAHGNVRWTVWSGTAEGVAEQPQNFYTFGGQEAGGLVDVVLTTGGALLLGSWTSDTAGTDAAVWTRTGSLWTRQSSTGTPLASTRQRIVGVNAAAALGKGVVIAGSVTRVTDGVRQRAHAWQAATVDGPWAEYDLPTSSRRSDATSIACGTDRCWLAGYADDQLALWSLDGEQTAEESVPSTRIDIDAAPPLPIVTADGAGICYLQGDRTAVMLPGDDGTWDQWAGPEGEPVAAVVNDGRLVVITRQADSPARLWSAPLPR